MVQDDRLDVPIVEVPEMLATEQVASLLHVHPRTVLRLRRRKVHPLPSAKLGKGYIYPAQLVMEWVVGETRRQSS